MNVLDIAPALLGCVLAVAATGTSGAESSAPRSWPVADFENDLIGWSTNDTGKAAGKTRETTLVSMALDRDAHTGKRGLRITFRAGSGFANAFLDCADLGSEWAARKVDELRFWMKGDVSHAQVLVDLQSWDDEARNPLFFQVPISLTDRDWHEIALPLARFQEADPSHPLRLPSLISLQFDQVGEIRSATLWIDDVRVAAAHGEGARFAKGPFDDRIAAIPPAGALPRLGNWMYPGADPEIARKCLDLGIRFSSNWDRPLVEQKEFLQGIVTNLSPGRPSGGELVAGLGLTDADFDQDSAGRRTGEGVESAIFHPPVVDRFCHYVQQRIRARAGAPWVASVLLSSPISMYGEVHYAASTGGEYAVFSRPAKANYRRWLRARYPGGLSVLSRAWGRPVGSWDEIVPPQGPTAPPGGIDTRTEWSDFMHWYNGWLEEVTRRTLKAARKETRKPIAAMIGGPKIGLSQGIALGNVGPIVRMLGRVRPAYFSDTDAQTLFSCRYTRAACSQYGVDLMLEHVGPPYLEPFHQYNMLLNVLACGADHAHLATLGELFDDKHWFRRIWKGLAPVLLRYRTHYQRSDAAMFHSYVTSWYRPDRSNGDGVSLYDSTNTLWFPDRGHPSWGRALGSPDVLDDAMIEDGGLRGRKLLVIPNTSVTVTTRKAVEAIRRWVEYGGTLVGFGEGCLAYTLEADRSLRPSPRLAGLLSQSRAGDRRSTMDDGSEVRCPSSIAHRPLERRLGRGRVVLYPYAADPSRKGPDGVSMAARAVTSLIEEARRTGVRIWCATDAGPDINVLYAGRDSGSGRHLFTADLTRYVRNGLPDAIFWTDRTIHVWFDPSLSGEAELVGITDAFESSEGGKAAFDADSHVLTVRFTLPCTLTLRFGKSRNGLEVARHSLLLWQNGDLVLRGTEGYGVPQTQSPIQIGADGTLTPLDVHMLYMVHGDLHRPKFGRGPTFRLRLERPGAFIVHANSVTRSGAVLAVRVDGKEAIRRDLPDRDGRNDPFNNEYNEDLSVPLTAGEHEVQVDNPGGDWVTVDRYVFRGFR